MNCKYCGAELAEDNTVCPDCGKAQTETEQSEVRQTTQLKAGKKPADVQKEKKEKRKTGLILGVAVAALVIIIALLVWKIVRDSRTVEDTTIDATASDTATTEPSESAEPTDDESSSDEANDGDTTIELNGVSYTVTEDALTEELLDAVVAKCGEMELTNRALPIYYWQQYMSFANSYGYYLSYMMDTSLPLDQQMYDEESTWQQIFIRSGMDMFRYCASLAQEAETSGFTLSAESQTSLDSLLDDLTQAAQSYGFTDADAYLVASFGPSVSVETYTEFLRAYWLGSEYLNERMETQQPTDAEIEAYYDENAANYEANRVEKINKPMVNIRHILIAPEAAEDGTYSDEAWAEAEEKANEVLNEWLAGEKSENSFATLANEYSEDPGSNTNGGLYTDVFPGQMVTAFNDWCFDDARAVGDYGLVRSEEYGYFIIYFSGVADGEKVYWFETAKSDYLNELAAQMQDEIVEKYTYETYEENSALVDLMFAE